MAENLSKKTVRSSLWSIVDVLFRQGISFVISIILARLLSPSDYGTIGVMMIFITISNVFVDSGFSSGLIRKIDRTDDDLSTAFYFNIFVAIGVYSILFFSSPLIASFFNIQELTTYLRILGLVLMFNSLNMVQNAILISSMRIKQMTMVSAISQISTGFLAIFLAYHGWGVWALIWQQLFAAILQAFLLAIATRWKPKRVFKKKSFSYLWGYGSKLLTANLIGTLFNQAYSFVIGKILGKRDLGLYSRSQQFAVQPENIVTNIISKALVPSLAACQNDLDRLKRNYKKCVEIISFLIFPLMFTLGIAAEPVFKVLFGSKWDNAIPLFQILCFGYAIDIFSNLSLNLIQVMGRTDFTLKLEFIKKPFYAIIIVVSVFFGLKGIVIGQAFYCLVAALINLSVVKFLLKYGYWKQVLDIFKYALISFAILLPTYLGISLLSTNNFFRLVAFPIIGIGIYALLAYKLKFRVIDYVKQIKANK